MLEIPLINLALFLVAAITAGLAVYAFANIKVRGALEFCLLMVSLTFYIGGFGFELLAPGKAEILFWLKIEYIGISTIPSLCILLAIRLAGNDSWMKLWPLRVYLLFPVLNLLVYYTNEWHHLFYTSIGDLNQNVPYSELNITRGFWYYLNIIYLNLGLLVSLSLFASKLRKDIIERRQAWIMILASLGPWIAHLLYQLGFSKGLDISPFGFLLTAPLFAWGVFGNYVVFFLPRAREAVYQSFRDAVFILDNQMNLIDFNKAAENLFKTLTKDSFGKPANRIFEKYPIIINLIQGADNNRIQVRFHIDNVKRSFVVTNSSVNTQRNRRLGIIIVFHEITDQVFLLDNLRESEEKYRVIFENTPVGVIQYDTTGKITMCNDAFVQVIGSSRELLVGLSMLSLPDEILVKAVSDSLNGIIGYYEHEYHSVTASKVTPVRGFFAPITSKEGQIRGGVGIIEDYTERFEADRQIVNREAFETMLIALELDFLNTELNDIDGTFNRALMSLGSYCKVNRAYIFRFDFDQKTMTNTHEWCSPGLKKPFKNYQTISIEKIPRWMEKLTRSEIIYIPNVSELTPDWISEQEMLESQDIKSLIIVPIQIRGELLGFAGFDSVNEFRSWNKDEISLLQVLGQVFASVIKRKAANEELILAKETAEEANQVKSTFLAHMSHEIRTPLSGVLGFAELIQAESDNVDILKYSEIILSSGNRLLQTLSQILDLSRVESGNMEFNIETVNINRVIDDVIILFAPNGKKKGLFIERQLGGPPLIIQIDVQLFRSSLTNLISNAIKFTDHGGITISTAIETVKERRFGLIRVSDTGIGIPEKYQNKIFEDFRQVSEGIKRNYEGTGLGLSLTRKFVEISGGTIKVESNPGFGTTFTMSFPDPLIE
jgi:hypothetical protein